MDGAASHSAVLETVGQYLSRLIGDRFTGFSVRIEDDHESLLVRFKDPNLETDLVDDLALKSLSEGTADKVFLALRLAGIRERRTERSRLGFETLPVVLDDILVAHDDERSACAVEVLAELSAEFQGILLVHDRAVLELAQTAEDAATFELPEPHGL